jgi:hypothetical protein
LHFPFSLYACCEGEGIRQVDHACLWLFGSKEESMQMKRTEEGSSGSFLAAQEILEMLRDLCDIAGYGIESGTNVGEKGEKAACYILNRLHGAGLTNARLEPITVNSPFPEHYEVFVEVDGKGLSLTESCVPLHWTSGTPREGITGNLAYVGDGSSSYFRSVSVADRIVLVDERFMRGYVATAKDATISAKDRGALAVLRANLVVDSPQQQKGEGTSSNIFPIPVFCLSKTTGDYLRGLVSSATPHVVRITLDVPHKQYDAFNIVLELPGSGHSDEVILVGTHYDTGHFTGAVDNNGSVALMIKLAQHFASKPKASRNRDMIFAWCLGHDFDMNSGHHQFAEAHKDRLARAIVWDIDHALGGMRYRFDESMDAMIPVEGETCEFYVMSNNYIYSRLATFTLEKHGFVCTQNRFETSARGPQWGMAPSTCPWVNVASIPLYYHSIFDTPDKVTLSQAQRSFAAHREIIEHIDGTPEGLLYYDNISKNSQNKPLGVSIAVLSKTVRTGDTVYVWNDETRFSGDKASFHCPALPEWAGTVWDWGDGTPQTIGGPTASHIYEKAGVYAVTLRFTDREGAEGTAIQEVTVTSGGKDRSASM